MPDKQEAEGDERVIILGINRRIIILMWTGCLGIYLTLATASAQVPGGYITGYVLDEDGKPVPYANVSLWHDDKLWKPGNYQCPPTDNPQMTRVAYTDERGLGMLREGGFRFGFIYPGGYILMAEKDGYRSGSTSVFVNGSTTRDAVIVPQPVEANITLSGYHVPTLSPEQLAYTGAVAGEIRTPHGYRGGANASLWQNGQMVKRPDNPQMSTEHNVSGRSVDYLFEHLAPGRYTVMAIYFSGGEYNETVTVDVGTRPMRADIVLSQALHQPAGWSDISFTPTVGEFTDSDPGAAALPSTGSKPTPALPWFVALLVVSIVGRMVRGFIRSSPGNQSPEFLKYKG